MRKRWPVAIAITANSDWLKTEFSELKEIQPVVNKHSHPLIIFRQVGLKIATISSARFRSTSSVLI